jgi:predicted flavoprotein YhiN
LKFDVVIIGAGAAGLMCAIIAGRRGRRVALLEHNHTVGKKIRISGGGRCNFTNLHTSAEHFISDNPKFHKSALARYTPADFIALVKRHRIAFHEKKAGQLFCDTTSQAIIDMLLRECAAAGVDLRTSCRVLKIARTGCFELQSSDGAISCDSLVIATGGLSIPTIGASDFGYRIARQFGLRVSELRPALVPVTTGGPEAARLHALSGLSTGVVVAIDRIAFRENLLFTHRGLSGPAILQISSYWRPGGTITVDFLPDSDEVSGLPKRFRQKWNELYAPDKPMSQWSHKQLKEYLDRLHGWQVLPSGTEGYAKAEVTLGGVDTNELSSTTMESKRRPGLYFIGEVVDVTGQLGGYNFQWAWASGYAAGQYV